MTSGCNPLYVCDTGIETPMKCRRQGACPLWKCRQTMSKTMGATTRTPSPVPLWWGQSCLHGIGRPVVSDCPARTLEAPQLVAHPIPASNVHFDGPGSDPGIVRRRGLGTHVCGPSLSTKVVVEARVVPILGPSTFGMSGWRVYRLVAPCWRVCCRATWHLTVTEEW